MERLRIATRGSPLALAQAAIVSNLLRAEHPQLEVDTVVVRTTGDRDARPYAAIGGKGLFTAEVERAVVEGRADVAVHSAKDLTAALAPGCTIVCVPERAPVHDVVLGGEGTTGEERLTSLPAGAVVGTSSMRRRALLSEVRPDLPAIDFRGNVGTRIRKLERGEVSAAILAAAGLSRLGVSATDGALDAFSWVPAPAQGALAIEAGEEREDVRALFAKLNDPVAAAEVACERAFSARLEGGCSVPLGCVARASGSRLEAVGYLGDPGNGGGLRDRVRGDAAEAASLGEALADSLLASGGAAILEALRRQSLPAVPEP